MLRGAPARPQLVVDLAGRLGEGGCRLGPPLLREGIAALPGQLAVGQRLLAGLGQRYQGDAAETELASSAAIITRFLNPLELNGADPEGAPGVLPPEP